MNCFRYALSVSLIVGTVGLSGQIVLNGPAGSISFELGDGGSGPHMSSFTPAGGDGSNVVGFWSDVLLQTRGMDEPYSMYLNEAGNTGALTQTPDSIALDFDVDLDGSPVHLGIIYTMSNPLTDTMWGETGIKGFVNQSITVMNTGGSEVSFEVANMIDFGLSGSWNDDVVVATSDAGSVILAQMSLTDGFDGTIYLAGQGTGLQYHLTDFNDTFLSDIYDGPLSRLGSIAPSTTTGPGDWTTALIASVTLAPSASVTYNFQIGSDTNLAVIPESASIAVLSGLISCIFLVRSRRRRLA